MPDPTSKYITEVVADSELNTALQLFNATAAANAVALGLTPPNLTEIANASSGFTTNLNAWAGAKAAANLAHENKDIQKKSSKAVISKWAKVFRANNAISDALLDQLMLPPHKTPGTKTPPTTPLDLVANANGEGLVSLKWKRNGNTSTTVFNIEWRLAPGTNWNVLDSTTKAKYDYQANPGQYIAFRVTAKRNGLNSPASVSVVLWEDGVNANPTLQVAA